MDLHEAHLILKWRIINFSLYLLRPHLKSKLSLTNKVYNLQVNNLFCLVLRSIAMKYSKVFLNETYQVFQSICFRLISSSPRVTFVYVTNKNLSRDLNIYLYSTIWLGHICIKFHSNFNSHTKPLSKQLSSALVIISLETLWETF